jgi:hypothetical protein
MPAREQRERLDSWKEIADYLGHDVRTVIRWEKERGLPVRRLPGGKRQSVFAVIAEIDGWLQQENEPPEDGIHSPDSAESENSERAAAAWPHSHPGRPRVFWKLSLAGAGAVIAILGWMVSMQRGVQDGVPSAQARPAINRLGAPGRPLQFVRSNIETGVTAYRFAAADLNGDKTLDLVFSTAPGDLVGVLLGKGDGSFFPARLYGGCPGSEDLVITDLNGDGIPDIAVTCFTNNSVLILWGRGDGTFPERTVVPVPGGPRFLASGDVNQDGWPDLIVSSFGEPALYLLTNHSGRFSTSLIARFEAAFAVTTADWNGDGVMDLIAGVRARGKFGLALFQGTKDGPLKFSKLLDWGEIGQAGAAMIKVTDINGDGIPDIVASLLNGRVFISRGGSGGNFSAPQTLVASRELRRWRTIALADLDLDGKPDLLVSNSREYSLDLLTGVGDGTFASGGSVTVGSFPVSCIVADFNNDGLPDIFASSFFEGATMFRAIGEKNGLLVRSREIAR